MQNSDLSCQAVVETSYSGTTYVAIRSGRHDSSSAYSHGKDFNHLKEMREFSELLKMMTISIAVILCDVGPDENPRIQIHWMYLFSIVKRKV